MKFHSELHYVIYGSRVRIGDSSEGLQLTSLREHTPVEWLLGQLAVGRVMKARHQINRNTALYCILMGERRGDGRSESLSLCPSLLYLSFSLKLTAS